MRRVTAPRAHASATGGTPSSGIIAGIRKISPKKFCTWKIFANFAAQMAPAGCFHIYICLLSNYIPT